MYDSYCIPAKPRVSRRFLPVNVQEPLRLEPEEFVERYTSLFDITPEILKKRHKNGEIVKVLNRLRLSDIRKVACIYLREYSTLTLREIASLVGYDQDHSGVITASRVARNLFETDDAVFMPYWNKIYEL
jgi:chromosomal replication initiation ATPase DnaA